MTRTLKIVYAKKPTNRTDLASVRKRQATCDAGHVRGGTWSPAA
ncbi:MAG: hypothetical protein AAFP90_23915 [Planctomycetota bacterium]